MINKAMEEKLNSGSAVDLSGLQRTPSGDYILPAAWWGEAELLGRDFCDAKTEEWMWSIGRDLESGDILASTSTKFYQNPEYECLWLR